jgi:hypothetical protein
MCNLLFTNDSLIGCKSRFMNQKLIVQIPLLISLYEDVNFFFFFLKKMLNIILLSLTYCVLSSHFISLDRCGHARQSFNFILFLIVVNLIVDEYRSTYSHF